MIVGSGLVANTLKKHHWNDNYLFFASGVANSKTHNEEEFRREYELVQTTINENKEKVFVYFSTMSIYDERSKESPYVLHKLNIENYIKTTTDTYQIIRVSNLVGSRANKHTILSYLTHAIKNDVTFDLWTGISRNFVDIDDFAALLKQTLLSTVGSQIIHIFNKNSIEVLETVRCIEDFYSKKALFNLIEPVDTIDDHLRLPACKIVESFPNFGNPEKYIKKLLTKYDHAL